MEPRDQVIRDAVEIEKSVSELLCIFLNIDLQASKILGDSSSSISFKSKLLLLFECKIFNKEQRQRLELFAEVRNKFAHSYDINNFYNCFVRLNNIEKLKKLTAYDSTSLSNPYDQHEKVYACLIEIIKKDIERAHLYVTYKNAEIILNSQDAYILNNLFEQIYKDGKVDISLKQKIIDVFGVYTWNMFAWRRTTKSAVESSYPTFIVKDDTITNKDI